MHKPKQKQEPLAVEILQIQAKICTSFANRKDAKIKVFLKIQIKRKSAREIKSKLTDTLNVENRKKKEQFLKIFIFMACKSLTME